MNNYDNLEEKIIDILKEVKSLKKFNDSETVTYTFVRKVYTSHNTTSTWKLLLDRTKTKLACRDAQGFKILDASATDQFIPAPAGAKDLLLAKSKEDRLVAQTMLDQLANEKYEQT